ncbi:MAG: nucleoside 2-deoxyribosyltransferase [Candidatus Thorarchaeota archaeon]|nr:nucleoside 2-deoxyribosyltransferase [Candidatus Thorarchaeota archaeon]
MTKAYLSGPIIHDDLRKDDFYRIVVETLESVGIEVFAPQFLPRDSPKRIYARDVAAVRLSNFLVAEVSNPSLGVGMEIMLAIEHMIPVLLFRDSRASTLSYMVQGADGTVLFDYSSLDEVRAILSRMHLDALLVKRCEKCESQVAEVDEVGLHCVKCGYYFQVEE